MAKHDGPPLDDADPVEGHQATHPHAGEIDELNEPEAPLLPSSEPLHTIFRAIGVIEQILGILLLLAILGLVLVQVAQRYLPGEWPWTGELARYSMVWATFFLAGYLVAYPPHHIAIHVVDFVVGERFLALIKLFVNLVLFATSVFMIYGSYRLIATDIGQVTPAGEMSMKFVNTWPLVGLILVAIRAVLGIVVEDVPALRARNGDGT